MANTNRNFYGNNKANREEAGNFAEFLLRLQNDLRSLKENLGNQRENENTINKNESDFESKASQDTFDFNKEVVTTSVIEDNEKDALRFLSKADMALNAGDPQKAERIFEKVERMHPSMKPEIDKIRDKYRSKSEKGNKGGKAPETSQDDLEMAKKCKGIAETHLQGGDRDKALHFIKKAKRLDPNIDVKELEELIEDRQVTSFESTSREEQINFFSRLQGNKEISKYIQTAQDAFNDKDFYRAERFLVEANQIYPSAIIDNYLHIVRTQRQKQDQSMNAKGNFFKTRQDYTADNETGTQKEYDNKRQQSYNSSERSLDEDKEESKKCIKLAQNAISVKDYQKAYKYLFKSDRLYPNEKAKSLLLELESKKEAKKENEVSTSNKNNWNETKETSTNVDDKQKKMVDFVKEANRAIDSKNYQLAEFYVLNAQRLCSTKEDLEYVKKLRIDIKSKLIPRNEVKSVSNDEKYIQIMSMEERKTEAQICIKLAQKAISERRLPKAEFMLREAMKYYPFAEINEYLYDVLEQK